MDSTQNIISICSGYSGLELGLRRAGVDVRTVCYLEIEVYVQAVLVKAMEEGRLCTAPVWSNAKTFPASEFRGKIHGITAGYPCQPFSSAGKRKGEEDPRHLWPYIREHVRAIRPLWCFFENVRGHTSMGLWRVLSDLEEDGYRTEWGLFSAEETGAPHQRIRCFILAYRGGLGSTPGISGQIAGQEGQSEEFNHDSGGQLVNPASEGLEGCARESVQGRSEGSARTDGAELGDTKHDGSSAIGNIGEFQGESDGTQKASEQSEGASGQKDLRYLQATRWPARPGEEQYAWEEPRVVVDSKESRLQGCGEPHTEDGRECEKDGAEVFSRAANSSTHEGVPESKESTGKAQSELGGAVDGTQHRVDRLRLLGNGVVPQTAEIAWRTLWQRI